MKTQFIYLCFLSFFIIFSTAYSQIIPDFQVNENAGSNGANQESPSIASDENGNFIEMNSDGITIESATAVNYKASTDMTIESGTNLDIKAGAQLKAEGAAGAELSTSAIAVIQGSMVQIN